MYRNSLIALLTVVVLSAPVAPAVGAEVQGQVKLLAVITRQLTIVDKEGKIWTFRFNEATKAQFDDEDFQLIDLREGDRVTIVYYVQEDPLWYAQQIRCERR